MGSSDPDGRGPEHSDAAMDKPVTRRVADLVAGTLAMATHRRLGKDSPLRLLDKPLLVHICSLVDLVVPDAAETLGDAVYQARPGQRIVLRKGEYTVGATDGQSGIVGSKAADTVLRISKSGLHIMGEQGVVLRGMLILEGGSSGKMEGLSIVDGGDCCIKASSASWELENCHLQCGHASSIRATENACITLRHCRIGGEEPSRATIMYHEAYGSIQEFGISKRACYALLMKDTSRVDAFGCLLAHCSEAALFLSDAAAASLSGCTIQECAHAFVSGYGCGKSLNVSGSRVLQVKRLWFDSDRPVCCNWDSYNNIEGFGEDVPPLLAQG